jgi:hypothetical protein
MHRVVTGEMCWNEICGHHSLEAENPITRVQNFSVWVFAKFQAFAWNNCELIPKISTSYILCKILLDNGHLRVLKGPFHSIKLGQEFSPFFLHINLIKIWKLGRKF